MNEPTNSAALGDRPPGLPRRARCDGRSAPQPDRRWPDRQRAAPRAARRQASRCGPASRSCIAERLRGAARAEGGHRHQPDRRHARPDPRGRRDGRRRTASTWSPCSAPSTASAAPRRPAARRATTSTRAPGCPSTTPTSRRGARSPTSSGAPASTRWSSTSRTPARGSTPTSGRCTTAWSRPRVTGKRFVVLDRPNPTTGRAAARPGARPCVRDLRRATRDLPAARHDRRRAGPALRRGVPARTRPTSRCRSTSCGCAAGTARQAYADTGLPWVLPSPNMPTADTALVYPGTCMFEGTNLSEGRGTTRPFELVGAPYVDDRWAEALRGAGAAGRDFREAYFTPTFSKHVNVACAGVQLHVTDPSTLRRAAHRHRDDRGRQEALRLGLRLAVRTTGSTSSPARPGSARWSTRAPRPTRSWRPGRTSSPRSTQVRRRAPAVRPVRRADGEAGGTRGAPPCSPWRHSSSEP